MMFATSTSFLLLIFLSPSRLEYCRQFEAKVKHEFYPLRHCQRSIRDVVAFINTSTLEECADFAETNRGLAFNYSPKDRNHGNLFDKELNSTAANKTRDDFYNCEVVACPHRNESTLSNDTRFDYFSLYSFPILGENSTCVPSLGMFMVFTERSNYSKAVSICSGFGGKLAHVGSEKRSSELARLLKVFTNTSMKEPAYIGLNETRLNSFWTSDNEPLKCFNFRAWASGHPPDIRKTGCVALTPEATWKVFNCNKKLSFICELLTNKGPNPYVNNLKEKCSTKRPNNRFMLKSTVEF